MPAPAIMRILIAHEALAGAGGVESYLASLMPALVARGHQLAYLHHNRRRDPGPVRLELADVPAFAILDDGFDAAIDQVRAWRPDVCFSHNMRPLEVDAALAREWPTVKMMHGYFGTCVSGQKAHAFPSACACSRTFGAGCLALYLPRRCGQLRPALMFRQFSWALRQRALFPHYAQVVVASAHMAAEYARHGVQTDRLTTAPLFPTVPRSAAPRPLPVGPAILFAGRMTSLKGGDSLIEAAAHANRRLGQPLRLLMAGDGPERLSWRALAAQLGVEAEFPGWLTGDALAAQRPRASLAAVPSRWPEPFGLAGLDAAAHGIPAVAFDVGGIGEWLRDGVNGRMVDPAGGPAALGAAIVSMFETPGELQRLGDGAFRAARTYSIDAHIDILDAVFGRARQGRQAFA